MSNTRTFTTRSVRKFVHEHDDLPAFHAAFLVLTFLAAAMFNLGFFAVLILIHMALDVFKYREVHGFGWKKTAEGVFRESTVDIALFGVGLVVAVYLHPSLAFYSGIKGLILAELTVLRAVGILTPKIKILYDFLKILTHVDHYLNSLHPRLGRKTAFVEYVSLFSLCITCGMLLIAPVLLMINVSEYAQILMGELTPWKL